MTLSQVFKKLFYKEISNKFLKNFIPGKNFANEQEGIFCLK